MSVERSDVLDAVDALSLPTSTKVVSHSDDGQALCTPVCPDHVHTHTRRVEHESLLDQLEAAIRETMAARPGGGASLAHTRGMLDSDALFLFSRISSTISEWAFAVGAHHRGAPASVLRAWFVAWGQSEHPEESERISVMLMRRWAERIRATLDPHDEQTIEEPCPDAECPQGRDEYTGRAVWWNRQTGTAQTNPLVVMYRKDDGREMVDKARARCRACGTEWSARALAWELEQAAPPAPVQCPECRDGKPGNCNGWTLDADDNEIACSTNRSQ